MARLDREAGRVNALAARLIAQIRAAGPISVADYMEQVADFYYGSRDPFGAQGDFITAPEVSQIFGELVGLWCVDLWQRIGAPDPVLLVELGPGRGTLMADALRAARIAPTFLQAMRLHLVERSPALRQMQAEKLVAFGPQWHDTVVTLPPGPVLLIANEFLDALPIRQFEQHQLRWCERMVGLDALGEKLAFCLAPPELEIPNGARPENESKIRAICPAAEKLGETLGVRLRRQGGAALFIDYGYDYRSGEKTALGDTLQALRQHKPVPVLDAPGTADLTAHVDFAAFARAAQRGGCVIYGPVTQRAFLLRLGIETRRTKLLQTATPAQAQAIESGAQRLIDPAQMGSLFKVLALGQKGAPIPSGFDGETA